MRQFYSFPEIENFTHVYNMVRKFPEKYLPLGEILYVPQIKLHGTNASIVIPVDGDGEIYAQKRTGILTMDHDNYDFAKYVEANKSYFESFRAYGKTSVIFGEWAGPGIQKKVAVSQIERKCFFPFRWIRDINEHRRSPRTHVEGLYSPENKCYPITLATQYEVKINFFDPDSVVSATDNINVFVEEIDRIDPFIKAVFGIEGPGEGLVYYPFTKDDILHTSLIFKAKGEEHRVQKTKKAVEIDPVIYSRSKEFAEGFCTKARLDQGLFEVCGNEIPQMNQIGDYLKWVNKDILKESVLEFEQSGLDWKPIAKEISRIAREYLIQSIAKRIEELE